MFELKLVDIFSTLCVGFITVMTGIYIYFLAIKMFIHQKFDRELFTRWSRDLLTSSVKDTWYAFLAIIMLYFFGIIAGDLTGRMTDSDDHKASILSLLKTCTFMEQESHLRKEALFNLHTDSSITGLGTAVFLNKHIVEEGNRTAGTHFFADIPGNREVLQEDWLTIKRKLPGSDVAFTNFVFEIYYNAKNWVYSKDHEPLHELKDIQSRIDLSRSIVLIVAFSLVIILVMSAVFPFYYLYLRWKNRPVLFYIPLSGIFLLLLFLLICRECYHINEINYLKRAYGYYVSYTQREDQKLSHEIIEFKTNNAEFE